MNDMGHDAEKLWEAEKARINASVQGYIAAVDKNASMNIDYRRASKVFLDGPYRAFCVAMAKCRHDKVQPEECYNGLVFLLSNMMTEATGALSVAEQQQDFAIELLAHVTEGFSKALAHMQRQAAARAARPT